MQALGRRNQTGRKRRKARIRKGRKGRRRRISRRQIPPEMPVQDPAEGQTAPSERYNEGYNQGFDAGYNKGHDEGFVKGHYAGGDAWVDQQLPNGMILPEISVQTVIAAGINSLQSELYPIKGTAEVTEMMIQAMDERRPFSIVRLGDGELLTMAQEDVMPIEEVRKHGAFLPYAGIEVPDLEAKQLLLEAVRGANVVGIPLLRLPNFQHLAFTVFRANGIDYKQLQLTHSTINYAIYLEHWFTRMTAGRRVLTVGNKAVLLAEYLRGHGVQVADAVAPVSGMKDVPRVMREIASRDFDLALVSSGVSAVVLAHQIAAKLGKAALDFGHLADSMISGEAPLA